MGGPKAPPTTACRPTTMARLDTSPMSVPAASPVVSARNSPMSEHSTALTHHVGSRGTPRRCTAAPIENVASGENTRSSTNIRRT